MHLPSCLNFPGAMETVHSSLSSIGSIMRSVAADLEIFRVDLNRYLQTPYEPQRLGHLCRSEHRCSFLRSWLPFISTTSAYSSWLCWVDTHLWSQYRHLKTQPSMLSHWCIWWCGLFAWLHWLSQYLHFSGQEQCSIQKCPRIEGWLGSSSQVFLHFDFWQLILHLWASSEQKWSPSCPANL